MKKRLSGSILVCLVLGALGLDAVAAEVWTPVLPKAEDETVSCIVLNVGDKPITVRLDVYDPAMSQGGEEQVVVVPARQCNAVTSVGNGSGRVCVSRGKFSAKSVRVTLCSRASNNALVRCVTAP